MFGDLPLRVAAELAAQLHDIVGFVPADTQQPLLCLLPEMVIANRIATHPHTPLLIQNPKSRCDPVSTQFSVRPDQPLNEIAEPVAPEHTAHPRFGQGVECALVTLRFRNPGSVLVFMYPAVSDVWRAIGVVALGP